MKRLLSSVMGLFVASLTVSVSAQSFDASKTYTIVNNNDANMFMQDNGTGGVALASKNNNAYWKFVATQTADCYYIQNATTGKYIQGYSASEQEVTMGDTGVEYFVKADADGDLAGKFRMSCTANSPYDFSSGTLGLNWKNNNTVQSFASVAGGNPRSAWVVTEESMQTEPAALTSPWVGSDVAEGQFYLYNVESGLWLQNNDSKSEDWSTRAAIGTRGFEWNLVASDGAYALQPNFYVNGQPNMCWSINPGNNYIDTPDGKAWEFHAYDAMRTAGISNAFTINNGEYVLGTVKYNEGARQENLFTQEGDERWYLENPDFNKNMSERITWQLVTKEERLQKMQEEASEENPVDASWLIPGPDFANNDKRYEQWTRALNGGNGRSGDGGVHGSRCVESWNSGSIDFSITLNVPNGTYLFSLQGYYRDGSVEQVVERRNNGTETIRSYYFANEVEAPLMSILDDAKTEAGTSGYAYNQGGFYYPNSQDDANRCFNLHKGYVNPAIKVVVTTGQLKIGIKKTEGVSNDWTVFDNFHLTYLGNNVDLTDIVNALQGAIDQAEAWDASNTSDVMKQALSDGIAEAKAKIQSTDADELTAATVALNTVLETAKSVDVSVLRQTVAVAESGVDVTAANDVIANGTTKAEVDNALFDLRTARKLNALKVPDVFTGSEPVAEEEFFLYNIGTGMWLNHGSDWNTHAAIDVYALPIKLISAEDGKYKLQTHMFKNRDEKWINWNAYVDTGDQNTWQFNAVEGKDKVYTINSEGDRTDVGRLLGFDPYGPTDRGDELHYWSTVAKDRENVQNPNNQWKLVRRADIEAMMETATPNSAVDVSFLIDNPGLSRVWTLDNWTRECDGGNGGAHITSGDNGDFNRNSDYGWEVYDANSFSFTQTLTGLKPGVYEVSVNGFFRQGNGGFQAGVVNDGGEIISQAFLVANGDSVALPNIASEAGKLPGIFSQDSKNGTFANWPAEALQAFQTGLYKTRLTAVVGFNGELTLGVKQNEKETDGSWALFDSFRLAYLGPVQINTMSVLGDFTGGWELEKAAQMVQNTDNPAIWTLEIEDFEVTLEEGQTERTYEYKATANNTWGQYELPAQGNQNWVFGSEQYPAGIYDLVFTADTEKHELTLTVTFDETATGITDITADTQKAPVYNLQGQKMMKAQKGVNIIGGKKVVKK